MVGKHMVKMNKMIAFGILCLVVGAIIVLLSIRSSSLVPEKTADTSLTDIKKKGKLVIASDIEFEPMEFYDSKGNPAGFDIDIGRQIAKDMGVEAEIKHFSWDTFFTAVENGQADIGISSVTILPERTKQVLFSNPYLSTGQELVVRKDDTSILKPEDIKGKNVGVQVDTTGKMIALQLNDAALVHDYVLLDGTKENPNSGLLYDLKVGKVDVFIIDYIGSLAIVKNHPELKIVGGPFTQEYYGIITKLGNQTLINEINRIIGKMKSDGMLQSIKDTWLK
jgi:ABC-type amino acid transport substrate-binding protein